MQATFSFKSSRPSQAHHKRAQVSRACDWCRVHRVKCDNSYPCQNCQSRHGHCDRKEQSKTRTLPSAVREIERLEGRIKELEEQLANNAILASTASSSEASISRVRAESGKLSEGTYTNASHSQQNQWYGLLSNFYYTSRLRTYLAIALEQPYSDDHIQPNTASKTFISPTSSKPAESAPGENNLAADFGTSGSFLTGMQEDYFLGLFWESYHCTLQILDEGEFREHYRSLWKTSSSSRKPSALVDIILAVCMQHGLAFLPRENGNSEHDKTVVDGNDATIAGRWYYRRSQMLLNSQLENPTLMTLQCHIFTVLYLCNASYQNMAYNGLAIAVRTAHLLGLHLEPPEDMPRERRELRKRLWWTLFSLESKNCMKLGRPWCAPFSLITCQLPADDRELALISGSNFASYGENLTWLTYTLQMTKMVLATRTVYIAFSDKCAEIAAANSGSSLYKDPQTLEACAEFFRSQMEIIQNWKDQVPEAMKTKRKGGGTPLSTERTMLNVELYAPLWLQRQRLMLELFHNNLIMNLYRPFICFPSTFPTSTNSLSSTPIAESHSTSCINHAITITRIMHQILTSSEILSGIHETFHWQWNATVSLIGFILAYPLSPLAAEARDTINSAITVFETFGNHFAVGASAANVTRNLVTKADYLMERENARSANLSIQSLDTPGTIPWYPGIMSIDNMDPSEQSRDIMALESFPISGTTDLGFSFDSFGGFEQFYAGSANPLDPWTFGQM
jgi:Fungal specific transcription factor domain/Fungal Zn(2)-Cys(6) binuclear cluster domain